MTIPSDAERRKGEDLMVHVVGDGIPEAWVPARACRCDLPTECGDETVTRSEWLAAS